VVQGVVYWQPPKQALNKVKELVWEPSISRYGADEGIPELREALTQKVYNSEHSACFQLDDLCYGSGHWHLKGRQSSFDSLSAAFQLFILML
jgi:aspartate/methionine/tyrosine aminotransferase